MLPKKKPNSVPEGDETRPQQAPRARRLNAAFLSLESRLMFDAAAAATVAEVRTEQVAQEQAEAAVSGEGAADGQVSESSDSQNFLQALSTFMPNESRTEVVFVDPTVPNYRELLSGMDPNIEVVMLNGGSDGIEQMANALSGRTGIDAIHIVSHGSEGRLVLGTGALTQETMLGGYAEALAVIKQSLSETADLLVYGCNFSEGAAGQEAVSVLSVLTGADVAASIDATGAAALGGDWVLESHTGAIETAVVATEDGQANWQALLSADTAPSFAVGDGIVLTPVSTGRDVGNGLVVLSDGKLLVSGFAGADMTLARYHSDGTLDSSFGTGGTVVTSLTSGNDVGNMVAVQADGKILVAGTAGSNAALMRYNANGTLDTTFGGGDGIIVADWGSGGDTGYSVAVQADGKIVMSGNTYGGNNDNIVVMRFLSDGTPDTSFDGDGTIITSIASGRDMAYSLVIQSDGKLLVGGVTSVGASSDYAILRYNTDGSLDTSFGGGDGIVTTDLGLGSYEMGYSVALQPDGKIVLAGLGTSIGVVRYNTDGSLDASFGGGDGIVIQAFGGSTGVDTGVVMVQPDGKIVVAAGGSYNATGGSFGAIRFNADGTLDMSFGSNGIVTTAMNSVGTKTGVWGASLQADGKIVAVGASSNGSNDDITLVRYNADGTLDKRFDVVTTLGGTVAFTEGGSAVVLDSNVQIYDAELSAADNFNGATLTLARNGGASSDDVFSATGTLSLSGGNVVVSGTTIGTYTNSGGTLTLAFNSNATNARVNSAMQQIAYRNSSDAPSSSVRIDWTFNEGNTGSQGARSALTATGYTTVSISAVNDMPTLANLAGDSLAYSEGDGAIVIEQGGNAAVADVDSTNFDTGRLTVSFTAGSDSVEDALGIRNQGMGAGQIGVSGSNVTYGDVTIGTCTGGSGGANLVITFNSNATAAAVTALVKNITYENTDTAAPMTGARTVRYVLTDGDGGTSASYDATVTVSGINDAPVLSEALITLPGTDENTISSPVTVASLLTAAGYVDVDSGALSGIAITGATGSNPAWGYSVDGGATWYSVDFSGRSFTNALLLNSSTLIRYIPLSQNGETATISFVAWDQTTGTATTAVAESTADVTVRGGTTAYSSLVTTGELAVSAVNDSPDIIDGTVITWPAINEDTASAPTTVDALLTAANWSDVDTGALTGISVRSIIGNGTWEYSANGVSWTAFGSVSAAQQLLLGSGTQVRYVPDGANGETASLVFHAWDQTGLGSPSFNGSPQYHASQFAYGAAQPMSNETASVSLTVTSVNEAPTGLSLSTNTVAENAANGTAVGTVTGADPDAGDTKTYSLTDNAGGRFAIDSTTGVITVANGGLLDYEAAASHNVTVRVSDSGGLMYDETFAVALTNVNEAPVLSVNAGSTGAEGGTDTISGGELAVTDVDSADVQLSYSIGTGPAHGRLELTTNPGVSAATFTQADIAANRLVYRHDGSETTSDSFTFTVSDGAGGTLGSTTVTLTITPVNDAPTITSTGGGPTAAITVAEHISAVTIVIGQDVDLPAQALTYAISGGADQALFTIDAATGALRFTAPRDFEAATDANGDNVYVVQVRVTDSQGGSATQTLQVTVTGVADAVPPSLVPTTPVGVSAAPPLPFVVPPAGIAPPPEPGSLQPIDVAPVSAGWVPEGLVQEPAARVSNVPEALPLSAAADTDRYERTADYETNETAVSAADAGPAEEPGATLPPAVGSPPPVNDLLMAKLDAVTASLLDALAAEDKQQVFSTRVAAVSGGALSVGFVVWALRSTAVLASLVATLPAWQTIDPLPVVALRREEREQRKQAQREAARREQAEYRGIKALWDDEEEPGRPQRPV
ncbi:MAG: hypothetical protein LZF86_140065 [Nitrospira sp.]|nr:MAG: hypothetical protein LZF86_140065 [Nitrospira sp.]